jgi:hypothetical protein
VPWIWGFGLIAAHTYPFTLVLVEFYICDSQNRLRDFWHAWVVGIVYGFVNYYYTMISPEPVYPFLRWDKLAKDIIIGVLVFLFFGTFMMVLSSYIQESIMARRFKASW